jgi:hypothetical protein
LLAVDEPWHVLTTNMQGDIVKSLSNPQASLAQEKLQHGTHLILRRGSLVPKGLAHIKLLLKEQASENQIACPSKAPHMPVFCQIDVDPDKTSLVDLKCQIAELIEQSRQQHFEEENIRLRMFSKASCRPGRVLREDNASLKTLDISRNATLVIELLAHKEHLR